MESSANPMQSSFATGKGGSDGPCMMEVNPSEYTAWVRWSDIA